MASLSHDLYPDVRLIVQAAIYSATLLSAHAFIIKPALRLHNERRKRTVGAIDSAKAEELKAEALEQSYTKEMKLRTEEAKNLRLSEVLAGQAEAESILASAQDQAKHQLEKMKTSLEANVSAERSKLPNLVEDVVASIFSRLGLDKGTAPLALLLMLGSGFLSTGAFAAESSGQGYQPDTVYGIFWPYFQFVIYLAVLVWAGRKIITSVLEGRREGLRVKLSEAKQAVTLAHRKAEEYEKKIASLQKEVQEIRGQYVNDGVRERAKIVAEAQKIAEQMIKDAERTAKEMVTKSKEELKKELLELAIKTVETRLTNDVASSLDQKLKKEALEGIHSLAVH
jgi:F-type H+-transporting ATPase subunit b